MAHLIFNQGKHVKTQGRTPYRFNVLFPPTAARERTRKIAENKPVKAPVCPSRHPREKIRERRALGRSRSARHGPAWRVARKSIQDRCQINKFKFLIDYKTL